MNLKIISKEEEPLLSRIKVTAELEFENGTPSREEIKTRLVKDLGKDEKLIVVKKIHTKYGLKKAQNSAYAYENEEDMKKIEIQKKSKDKADKKEVKAEAKEEPKQEKQEEKKAEEKK